MYGTFDFVITKKPTGNTHTHISTCRYVVDLCVQHLASSNADATAGRPKKKQRKQQLLDGAEGEAHVTGIYKLELRMLQ
jgi:hypothetical protein